MMPINNNNSNKTIKSVFTQVKKVIDKSCKNIFSIEGNIASGKSTILDMLQSSYSQGNRLVLYREDVEKWKPYLHEIYNNPTSENCRRFQEVVSEDFKQIESDIASNYCPSKIYVIERSGLSSFHVFAKAAAKVTKTISKRDYCELKRMYKINFEESTFWNQRCQYIFLSTLDSNVLSTRIRERTQITGDNKISISYLDTLNVYYQKFYLHLLLDKRINVIKLEN